MVATRWVTSAVEAPERAAAVAASHPAWPPPMTMTSNLIPTVRLFHVKHRLWPFYFPTQSRANISPSTSSAPIRPTMRSIAAAARRRSSAISSHSAASGPSVARQGVAGVLKRVPMPLQREQGRLARGHALFGQIGEGVKQPIDARARFRRNGEFGRRCASQRPAPCGEAGRGVGPPPIFCPRVDCRRGRFAFRFRRDPPPHPAPTVGRSEERPSLDGLRGAGPRAVTTGDPLRGRSWSVRSELESRRSAIWPPTPSSSQSVRSALPCPAARPRDAFLLRSGRRCRECRRYRRGSPDSRADRETPRSDRGSSRRSAR